MVDSQTSQDTYADPATVIEGRMEEVPGPVDFHFDFGFPPKKSYACIAETMALALQGRHEGYSVGKELTNERAWEIGAICARHGFWRSGFRSFEPAVSKEPIGHGRERAQTNRKDWSRLRADLPFRVYHNGQISVQRLHGNAAEADLNVEQAKPQMVA